MISPLRLREKIGYGFGDAASSMFWKLFGMYLLFFYTDIFGIPAAVVGTMFLVTRLANAAFDPFVGILGDRTKSRWGKFRPYLLWMALPVGLFAVLTFTTPEFSTAGKIIYAYVTFGLMMAVYSMINVPYASLMGVMSDDGKERTTLATYRFIFAFGGSFLVLGLFQPLFDGLGTRTVAAYSSPHAVALSDSSSSGGRTLLVWEAAAADTAKGVDSLLYITAKVQTRSRKAFSLGLFDPRTGSFDGFQFGEGKDTLGLVRGGGRGEIKLRADRVVPRERLADLSHLRLATRGIDADSIKVESAALKEIDYRSGTEKAVIVVSLLAVIFFFFTFAWTLEKVKPIAAETSLKADLKDLSRNSPWFILVGASIFTIFLNTIRDGAAVYYFAYYFKGLTTIELSSSVIVAMSTLYLLLGQAANIVGVVMAKPVSDRIGKKKTFFIAMVTAAVLSFIFYFLNRTDVTMILILQLLISVNAGIIFPLIWSMFADTADYSEWRNKRRATGLVFSAASMSQKFGASVGIAMVGWILSLYGYRANVEQTDTALQGIRMMLSFYPGVGALLAALFVFIYPLKESVLSKIAAELNIFRAGAEKQA